MSRYERDESPDALSQVPRRATLGSMQKFGAGALVDRVLRFINN